MSLLNIPKSFPSFFHCSVAVFFAFCLSSCQALNCCHLIASSFCLNSNSRSIRLRCTYNQSSSFNSLALYCNVKSNPTNQIEVCLACSAFLYQCPWYNAFFSVVPGWSHWPNSHSPSLRESLASETSAKLSFSCNLSYNLPLCGKLFDITIPLTLISIAKA